jgi:hypothetical protein
MTGCQGKLLAASRTLSLFSFSVQHRSIVPYCQAWNLQFADKMQARLPPEMRDLVYHHLWDKSTITSFPGLSMAAGGASCIDDVCHCSVPHKSLRLPHFIMPDFMG